MMEKRQQAISKSDDYERRIAISNIKKRIDDKLVERKEKENVIYALEYRANETITETIDTENMNQLHNLEFVNGLSTIDAQKMLQEKRLDLKKIDNDLSNLTEELIKLEGAN